MPSKRTLILEISLLMNFLISDNSLFLINNIALASLGIALVLFPPFIDLSWMLNSEFNFHRISPIIFKAFPLPK